MKHKTRISAAYLHLRNDLTVNWFHCHYVSFSLHARIRLLTPSRHPSGSSADTIYRTRSAFRTRRILGGSVAGSLSKLSSASVGEFLPLGCTSPLEFAKTRGLKGPRDTWERGEGVRGIRSPFGLCDRVRRSGFSWGRTAYKDPTAPQVKLELFIDLVDLHHQCVLFEASIICCGYCGRQSLSRL